MLLLEGIVRNIRSMMRRLIVNNGEGIVVDLAHQVQSELYVQVGYRRNSEGEGQWTEDG